MAEDIEQKIVFNVHPATLAFTGPQQCYKTSIDPDTWQWTGFALEEAPPETGDNEIAVAKDDLSGWLVKPYFVGTKYWLPDGSKHIITEIGVVPPEDAVFEDPNADQIIIDSFKTQIQKRLDEFAQTRGYDNTLSCCTYADSAVAQFAAEGQYMKTKRDQDWANGYQIIAEVKAGNRPVPSLEELFAELGPLEWPN
jgi:hypothetical protein